MVDRLFQPPRSQLNKNRIWSFSTIALNTPSMFNNAKQLVGKMRWPAYWKINVVFLLHSTQTHSHALHIARDMCTFNTVHIWTTKQHTRFMLTFWRTAYILCGTCSLDSYWCIAHVWHGKISFAYVYNQKTITDEGQTAISFCNGFLSAFVPKSLSVYCAVTAVGESIKFYNRYRSFEFIILQLNVRFASIRNGNLCLLLGNQTKNVNGEQQ